MNKKSEFERLLDLARICKDCGNPFVPTTNEQEYCVPCGHIHIGEMIEQCHRMSAQLCKVCGFQASGISQDVCSDCSTFFLEAKPSPQPHDESIEEFNESQVQIHAANHPMGPAQKFIPCPIACSNCNAMFEDDGENAWCPKCRKFPAQNSEEKAPKDGFVCSHCGWEHGLSSPPHCKPSPQPELAKGTCSCCGLLLGSDGACHYPECSQPHKPPTEPAKGEWRVGSVMESQTHGFWCAEIRVTESLSFLLDMFTAEQEAKDIAAQIVEAVNLLPVHEKNLENLLNAAVALRQERDRLKEQWKQESISRANFELESYRLREAFENYGQHEPICQYRFSPDRKCDCGFDDLKAELLRGKEG